MKLPKITAHRLRKTMMTDEETIALAVYPVNLVSTGLADSNAKQRACALRVAEHFLDIIKSEKTARAVMFAFYRREHHCEPSEKDVPILSAQMGTALLAVEIALREQI